VIVFGSCGLTPKSSDRSHEASMRTISRGERLSFMRLEAARTATTSKTGCRRSRNLANWAQPAQQNQEILLDQLKRRQRQISGICARSELLRTSEPVVLGVIEISSDNRGNHTVSVYVRNTTIGLMLCLKWSSSSDGACRTGRITFSNLALLLGEDLRIPF